MAGDAQQPKYPTMFAIVNNTGEEWPQYGIAKLGELADAGERYGIQDEIPVYEIEKPDGVLDGFHVVNVGAPVDDGDSGAGVHAQDARYVRVAASVAFNDLIGPVSGEWYAGTAEAGWRVRDAVEVGEEDDYSDPVPVVWEASGAPETLAVLVDDLPEAPGVWPTGTIAADSDELTTSEDLSAYALNYTVVIAGAGEDDAPLQTTIASGDASSVTLSTTADTAVTDAAVGILAVADAWIMTLDSARRLTRVLDADDQPVTRPVVNRYRSFQTDANTLIAITFRHGEWQLSESDCEASEWPWDAATS